MAQTPTIRLFGIEPPVTSRMNGAPLDQQMKAGGADSMFTAEAASLTDDAVSSVADRFGGSRTLAQATAGLRPTVGNVALPGGNRPAFIFPGGTPKALVMSGAFDTSGPFSMMVAFQADADVSGAQQGVGMRFTDASNRVGIAINPIQDTVEFLFGSTPAGGVDAPLRQGEIQVAIFGRGAGTITVGGTTGAPGKFWCDGVRYSDIPLVGATGTAAFSFGALTTTGASPFKGKVIAVVAYPGVDIFDTTKFDAPKNWAKRVCNVPA